MTDRISDAVLNAWYARDYYGPGTNYFDPPMYDDLDEVFSGEEMEGGEIDEELFEELEVM